MHLTDKMAEQLLELIEVAVTEYVDCMDMKLSEFVDDIAMSMDVTTDKADKHRRTIEAVLLNDD